GPGNVQPTDAPERLGDDRRFDPELSRVVDVLDRAAAAAVVVRARRRPAVRPGAEQLAQLGPGPAPLALDDGDPGAVAGRSALDEHGAAVRQAAHARAACGDAPDLDDRFLGPVPGGAHGTSSLTCGASAMTDHCRTP